VSAGDFITDRTMLTFYACGACGAMSMDNFRDDCCRVCKVAMNVRKHVVVVSGGDSNAMLIVSEYLAPHVDDDTPVT
jgi:3-phosphoglycerate kinase